MKKSVTSPEVFNEEIRKLVFGEKSERYKIQFEHIDTIAFRQWYINQLSVGEMAAIVVRRRAIGTAIKHYPFVFLAGGVVLAKKKLFNACQMQKDHK